MPRSVEKEEFRKKLIEAAAGYLDAGREVEATLMERLPGHGRLVITIQVMPAYEAEAGKPGTIREPDTCPEQVPYDHEN
jgi:hypothetical protein